MRIVSYTNMRIVGQLELLHYSVISGPTISQKYNRFIFMHEFFHIYVRPYAHYFPSRIDFFFSSSYIVYNSGWIVGDTDTTRVNRVLFRRREFNATLLLTIALNFFLHQTNQLKHA